MGLFSAKCKCRKPILPTFNTHQINAWMSDCVAIYSDGKIVRGYYDGYGRLYDYDENIVAGEDRFSEPDENGHIQRIIVTEPVCTFTDNNDGPTVYHYACWVKRGSPTKYKGQSPWAPDQGHFFDPGKYDIPEPV